VTNYKPLKDKLGRTNFFLVENYISDKYNVEEEKDIKSSMGLFVFNTLLNKLTKDKMKRKANDIASRGIEEMDYSPLIPIIDYRTAQTIMFNIEDKTVIHEASYKAYEIWEKKQSAEDKKLLHGKFTSAQIDFDPTTSGGSKIIELSDGQEITSINSHNSPLWRKSENARPKMPELFKDLMNHLFPDKKCRQYVMFWAYNMLTSRSPVHLLLHGHHGIGKNTLVEIFSNLVGDSNYYLVPKGFWDNNFNSELRHRRLLYFDEHGIYTKQNLDDFKQLYDPRMTYHGKNLTIEGNEVNYASSIISNNLETINHLVYESRRFAVPVLTTKTLTAGIGEDKMDELYSIIRKPEEHKEFYSNLGHWILQNGFTKEFRREQPYKTSLFYEIVEKALLPWQRYIVSSLASGECEDIPITGNPELMYKGKSQGYTNCQNFLDVHKDEHGEDYGYVVRKGSERVIIPSKKYEIESKAVEVDTKIDTTNMEF